MSVTTAVEMMMVFGLTVEQAFKVLDEIAAPPLKREAPRIAARPPDPQLPLLTVVAAAPSRKRVEREQNDEALLDRITDIWNAWAAQVGSSRVATVALMTGARARHCRCRVDELKKLCGTEDAEAAFRALLAKCSESFFVRGSPRSKLKFDQIMREGFLAQMMEGAFEHQERKWR